MEAKRERGDMRTRTMLVLGWIVAATWAVSQGDLAAVYVAFGVAAIIYLLHAIGVKLNKLLDYHGIFVSDHDIARE